MPSALVEADVVIDCSGTYGNHNWLGQGGFPPSANASGPGRRKGEVGRGMGKGELNMVCPMCWGLNARSMPGGMCWWWVRAIRQRPRW